MLSCISDACPHESNPIRNDTSVIAWSSPGAKAIGCASEPCSTLAAISRFLKEQWPVLVERVQTLLTGQIDLEPEPEPELEREADRIAQRLLARSASERLPATQTGERATHTMYEDSLDQVHVRTAGIEALGLWALRELGLEDLLQELSGHSGLVKTALASIAMRLVEPGSERRTHLWLRTRSTAGELLGVDFDRQSLMHSSIAPPIC